MIDVKIFDSKEEVSVYVNDDIDFTALKILYDNCLRVGSSDNLNITIATVHPSLWFGELFEYIQKSVKLVPKGPMFQLMKIEDNQLISNTYSVGTLEFKSDEELKKFFEEDCKYKSLAMFSICKYLDMTNLSISWRIRCVNVLTKEEVRDKKLDSIINI
jgi:hypothetical protein